MDCIRKILLEKVNSSKLSMEQNCSDDMLSTLVIEQACKAYKKEIDKNLTPAQKADAVYHRYMEKLLAQAKKQYEKSDVVKQRETDEQVQKEIDAMSSEEKEELRKALGVEKLTGAAVGKCLKTGVSTTALMVALGASGFGAYMALSTIMHAIFTTTLGITLPFAAYTTATSILAFLMGPAGLLIMVGTQAALMNTNKNKLIYELLSQIVWNSVLLCGGRFSPRDEELPSWLPEDQKKEAITSSAELTSAVKYYDNLELKFQEMSQKMKDYENEIKNNKSQIETLKNDIIQANEKEKSAKEKTYGLEQSLRTAQENYDLENKKVKQLQRQMQDVDLTELKRAEAELKKAHSQIENNKTELQKLNQKIKADQADMDALLADVEQTDTAKQDLEKQNKKLQEDLEQSNQKVEALSNKEGKKLEQRWISAYKKFEFAPGVIKYVVKNYEYNEYGRIESLLMQIHEANDPAAISQNRGKMLDGNYHAEFTSNSGFPSRVFYIPISNQGGKTVRITDILKHNDPRYGKK